MQANAKVLNLRPLQTIWLLQVEDNPGDARLVFEMLSDIDRYQFELLQVDTLSAAIDQLNHADYDVLLLDLSLPDAQKLEALERVREINSTIPIIILTGNQDEELALMAVKYGAQDYLLKNELDHQLLMRTIRYAIDRKQAEANLAYLAQYDVLTGLANRSLFQDRLQQAIARAQRNQNMVALLFLDLDEFKSINDTYGHHLGDLLLQDVSKRLKECVRKQDTIARIGGDEFTIVLEDLQAKAAATAIAEKVLEALSIPHHIGGQVIFNTVSIGICIEMGSAISDTSLFVKNADTAMYRAKKKGRNMYKYFSSELKVIRDDKKIVGRDLMHALKRNEFFLRYQPQFDVRTNELIGAEALLRWRHPQHGVIYPKNFISMMEDVGEMVAVGDWVLRTACMQWADWQQAGVVPDDSSISINLSAYQFRQGDLVDKILHVLYESGLQANHLDLEITEDIILENNESYICALQELKRCGVCISIDNVSENSYPLRYLRYFSVDRLKLERSFVRNLFKNKYDIAIAKSIVRLAEELKLQTIVKGIDSFEQVNLLYQQGFNLFQGFHFSEPLMPQDFAAQYGKAA